MKTGRFVLVIAVSVVMISALGSAVAETSISVEIGGAWSSAYGGNPAYGTPYGRYYQYAQPNVTLVLPSGGHEYVPYDINVPYPGDLHRSYDGSGPYGFSRRYDIYGWGPGCYQGCDGGVYGDSGRSMDHHGG